MSSATSGVTGPPPPTAVAPADVDWDAVGRWAGRLAPPGPTPGRRDLERTVADLRDAARRARPHAVRASRLEGALEASGGTDATVPVLVVDRPGWARAAAQSFARLSGAGAPRSPLGAGTLQAAALVGVLAGRVLGQFDPYTGRLLLVAPNVLRTERAISADSADFRLWVCVHEQTHALQFAAAPWLADHLRHEVRALLEVLSRTSQDHDAVGAALDAVRGLRTGGRSPDATPLHALLDAEQRERVDRLVAVMSLLEGHADVTMDAVGRTAIPSVRRLRSRMERRRAGAHGPERVLRRLLGLDVKIAQYRQGARFVRAVRRSGGRHALDAAWTGPQMLPTPGEIADPRSWVRRVHG